MQKKKCQGRRDIKDLVEGPMKMREEVVASLRESLDVIKDRSYHCRPGRAVRSHFCLDCMYGVR